MRIGPFGRREQPKQGTRDLLRSYPLRNPLVQTKVKENGEVQLEIPLKKPSRWVRLLASPPEKKVIELDKLGSFVWNRCDGNHSFEEIVDDMVNEFKFTKAEARVSLTAFLKNLAEKGLMAFFLRDQAPSRDAPGAEQVGATDGTRQDG